jgi:hypothetical protein
MKIARKSLIYSKLFLIFTICLLIYQTEAGAIFCEGKSNEKWLNFDNLTTCKLNDTTVINDPFTTFSEFDVSVNLLWFMENKNIFHLPVELAEKLPNLIVYAAAGCSLKKVTKKHFEGLTKLTGLYLGFNQLKVIHDSTFEDIKMLEFLDLCEFSFNFDRKLLQVFWFQLVTLSRQ